MAGVARGRRAAAPGRAFAQTTTGGAPAGKMGGMSTTTPTSPMAHAPGMASPMASPSSSPSSSGGMSSGAMSSGGLTHYASQSEAASSCPGDTVVWASPRSKALPTSDSRYFGKSKHGFYACEKTAMGAGYHLAGTGTGKKHKTS